MAYKQAIIYFKDGTKDWVDPIVDDSINNDNKDFIIINNGIYSYEYNRLLVDKIEIVDIVE
jgi:hypothetical protein